MGELRIFSPLLMVAANFIFEGYNLFVCIRPVLVCFGLCFMVFHNIGMQQMLSSEAQTHHT